MGKIAKYNEKTNVIDIINIDISDIELKLNEKFDKLKEDNGVTDEDIKKILDKSESERTDEDNLKLVIRKQIKDLISEERKKYDGYSPYVEIKNNDEVPYGYLQRPTYKNEDGKVICTYESYLDYYFLGQEVKRVKQKLSNTDYIIIKCYEAELLGEELPYDKEFLKKTAVERAEMRDQINQLQAIIDNGKTDNASYKES